MAKCQAEKLHPKEYKAWCNMKRRCSGTDPKHHNYVSNTITVCDSWLQSFWNFFNDVGPSPSSFHSIDRIDNLKGYSPDNVRWATASIQNNNKSKLGHLLRTRDDSGKFISGDK